MATTKYLLRELKEIPFSGECISKEKLVQDMVAQERAMEGLSDKYKDKRIYSPMTVCVTELSEFLAISQAGMIGFLTDVYDQDFYEHKTKNKGTEVVTGPFLNLIACTTPEWITTYLRSDIISGGFSRRTLFVFETEKAARIPFPKVTDEMRVAWNRLFTYAQKLLHVRGPFQWHPEARKFYAEWYIKLEMPKDENIVGYFETKHIQMLKLAMLVALSEESDGLILKKSHIDAALAFLGLVEANLARVFQSMGRNLLNHTATKILEVLRSAPTKYKDPLGVEKEAYMLTTKRLQAIMFRDVAQDDFAKVVEHLIHTDKIEKITIAAGGVTKEYIRLKV